MSLIKKFSEHEDDLIRRFHQHPFFVKFSKLTDEKLKYYLTQKWILSQNFVPWYDRAINGLLNEEAKEVLKKIVQDETPIDAPSHREDLLADLEFIGIPRSKVLTTRPTRHTLKSLNRINDLAKYTSNPDHDLIVMSALRTAGEILVAEEYRHVVPELEIKYGLSPEKSRFYAPHFYHDRKDSETGQHTHSFESVLERMISDRDKLRIAVESAENAFKARTSFYDQFTSKNKVIQSARVTGAIAAALVGFSLFTGIKDERTRYSEFVQSLEPQAKENFLDADKWLAKRFVQTGNLEYLTNIGTFEAQKEVYGEGP